MTNNYTREMVLNGELGRKILEKFDDMEEGNYSTKIARSLGKDQQNVWEIIEVWREIGFLKKGKRGQAQYYELTETGKEYIDRIGEVEELRDVANKIEKRIRKDLIEDGD